MHVPQRIRPQHRDTHTHSQRSHDGATIKHAQGRTTDATELLERAPSQQEILQGAQSFDNGLVIEASAPIPTEHGIFVMMVFRWPGDAHDHVAMVRGDVRGKENVAVRMHSECLTSEVFHSLKCDCREQLHTALRTMADRDEGVLIYLRQEGRGIGLANKVRAYALQAHGVDTVDANRMLGLPDDTRRYDMAAMILQHLGVKSVSLMTNNPAKLDQLRSLGVPVSERLPVLISPNPHSIGYLEAKRLRMRHQLPARTHEPTPIRQRTGSDDAE